MQQLVIKLSPAATAAYLKNELENSAVQLDINMSMISGLRFADVGVNGQSITSASDDEDLEFELINVN